MERICGGSERIEEALVFLRIGSTPRTLLRTRSTVRALVPARCSTGPPRTVSSPAKGVSCLASRAGLSQAVVDEGLNNHNLKLNDENHLGAAPASLSPPTSDHRRYVFERLRVSTSGELGGACGTRWCLTRYRKAAAPSARAEHAASARLP